jgi:Clp amino terminal domain, pathogenicity island component
MTELLSAAEAARILGVSRGRVVELATSDPGFPPSQPSPAGGRAWSRVAVEAWAAAHPDRGPLHRGPTLPEVGGRSPQVWKVANLAGEEAQARNHTWIGPDHLLAALVHPDCPGTARAVLASLGITAERLQRARERSFVDPFEPGSGWKQVSPAFQLALERANLEAVLLADTEVTSEHVLLALASQWAADAQAMAVPPRGDLDPSAVRRRVLDITEGVAVPPPPAPQPPPDPEEAMGRVAPGLELAPTPDGKDPRRRMPWGSRIFVDADGTPIKQTDGLELRQYFVDRDGNPVLTSDGQPVHGVFDEHGRDVLAENGQPLVVPVEIPEGSRVEPHTRST